MSGSAFGTVVVHVSPESAVGGPLAAVRTGDIIEMDVPQRRLDMKVEDREVRRSRLRRRLRPSRGRREATTGCSANT